jgi:general secretion pathway protein G
MHSLSSRHRYTHSTAFTLLEIMLVVMIIALLAGAAIHFMGGNFNIAADVRARADIQNLASQLMLYSTQNGSLPKTAQGLKALVERPTDDPQPRRWVQLLPEVPEDPWHLPYILEVPARRSKGKYDLFSAGPDQLPNTADDIGNWAPQ